MFTELLILKSITIFLLLMSISFFVIKKFRLKKKSNSQFKHNISLLRNEKLLIHSDKKTEKKRQRLLKKTINVSEDTNSKQLISKSKKMGLSAGEILLASKIRMSTK
jgi:hypothetical protein